MAECPSDCPRTCHTLIPLNARLAVHDAYGPTSWPLPLLRRLNQHCRLAIQDGSKSEAGAQKKYNPQAHLFGCKFHIKSELRRRGEAGAKDSTIYEAAMWRSKRHKHEVDLCLQQMKTAFGKGLATRAKEETYPAHLPVGVGTHGNTTGNAAEIHHVLFESMRKPASLFTSIRAAVEVLYRRDTTLRSEYKEAVAQQLGKPTFEVCLDDKAPHGLVSSDMHEEFRRLSARAKALEPSECHLPERPTDSPYFTVVDRGERFTVYPAELLCTPVPAYERVCQCTNVGNVEWLCSHTLRCLLDSKLDWRQYVKRWQTGEAWRQQCLPQWAPPGAHDAMDGARQLQSSEQVSG